MSGICKYTQVKQEIVIPNPCHNFNGNFVKWTSLVQIMGCRLEDAKLLSEQMLEYR